MPLDQVPVLVVGAGLGGLTAANILGAYDIPCLLIERHKQASKLPRSRGINFRSMELLRVAGADKGIREVASSKFGDFKVVMAESVFGTKHKTLYPRGAWDTSELSNIPSSDACQDLVEPLLRENAEKLGVHVNFSTELVGLCEREDEVSVTLRDRKHGSVYEVRAQFVVAADGARSSVRRLLGIGTHGHGTIANYVSILFETDVLLPDQCIYYFRNPTAVGAFVNTNAGGKGAVISVEYNPDVRNSGKFKFDLDYCLRMVKGAIGLNEIVVNIVEVAPWEMAANVADRFATNRVFLIGDAAHSMPPTGGLGGQVAIQDGFDIAWKLNEVIRGHAHAGLLSTYETERRPVAEATVLHHVNGYFSRLRPGNSDPASDQSEALKIAFGYRYHSEAIVADRSDAGAVAEDPYELGGEPGTHIPFVDVLVRGERLKSPDLLGRFALAVGPKGQQWADAARRIATDLRISLMQCQLDVRPNEGEPPPKLIASQENALRRLGIAANGALLVRPDGFIAWRSVKGAEDCSAILRQVLATALRR